MADKMYAGVKALIERDGKYLFVGYELNGEMLWIPPGGRLEHGEKPLEGLKREVRGEVSLEITPGKPIGMYHFFIGSKVKGDQVSLTLFEIEDFSGEVDIDTEHAKDDGLQDYKWMGPEEIIEENITESLKDLLSEKIFHQDLPKLVRDKIPEIIREDNQTPEVREVSDSEAEKWLRRKIVEEAEEFEEEGDIEELADLFAVMEEYMERKDIGISKLRSLEEEKSNNRGGFKQNIVLDDIDE